MGNVFLLFYSNFLRFQDVASTSSRHGSRRPSSNVMTMEREQVAALEQQQLLKGSNDGSNSFAPPSAMEPITPKISTISSLTPSSTLNTRGYDNRKYSSGFDTRKYSTQADPYRKYSSASGYGGRSYLSPNSGYPSTGTGSAYGGTTNQQVPMIDDK